jgi:hypothetical protein
MSTPTALEVLIPVTQAHLDAGGDPIAAAVVAALPGATSADPYWSAGDDDAGLCAVVWVNGRQVHLEFGPDGDSFAVALDAGADVEPAILAAVVTE